MSEYTVMFIGHRYITAQNYVYKRIKETVYELLETYSSLEILIGNDGDFDTIAASAVKNIKKESDADITLVLVLPYSKNGIKYFEQYYDEVEICAESTAAHFKAAIQLRNRQMVDRSDIVLAYVEHPSGGAYQTLKYAQSIDKEIINLAK